MNQAILFSDDEQYLATSKQLRFHAQYQGKLLPCFISTQQLCQLAQQSYNNLTQQQALALFDEYRFDIEELAEKQIYNEQIDPDGQVFL